MRGDELDLLWVRAASWCLFGIQFLLFFGIAPLPLLSQIEICSCWFCCFCAWCFFLLYLFFFSGVCRCFLSGLLVHFSETFLFWQSNSAFININSHREGGGGVWDGSEYFSKATINFPIAKLIMLTTTTQQKGNAWSSSLILAIIDLYLMVELWVCPSEGLADLCFFL